jgi:hypothetical protein
MTRQARSPMGTAFSPTPTDTANTRKGLLLLEKKPVPNARKPPTRGDKPPPRRLAPYPRQAASVVDGSLPDRKGPASPWAR